MYLRAVHAEADLVALRQFIYDNPLGMLVTALQSPSHPVLQCTHLPWVIDIPDEPSDVKLGTLRGHMARANPHAKALIEAAQREAGGADGALSDDVTVMFTGPAHSYVPPRFYVETKPASGKVVPTWNYSAVQVYGKARVMGDANSTGSAAYLQKQVEDLTRHSEQHVMQHAPDASWNVSDAPTPYVEIMRKAIIGIEIEITRLEGKHKMSQELSTGDRAGVIEGFKALDSDQGRQLAERVEERSRDKDSKAAR